MIYYEKSNCFLSGILAAVVFAANVYALESDFISKNLPKTHKSFF